MKNERIRVGIIGTGVGVRTYLPAFRRIPGFEVVGISGSSPERAAEVAAAQDIPRAYADHADLCSDESLDLICITSPNPYHLDHYERAVATGRNILIEKPVAVDSAELRQFLSFERPQDALIMVDHQLRFNPYFRKLREVIQEGALGHIYHIRIHQQGTGFFSFATPHSWSFDAELGGGVRLAMGSHLVDLLSMLTGGQQVRTVMSSQDVVIPERQAADGTRRAVTASATFSTFLRLGETSAFLSATAAAAAQTRFDIDVLGADGEAHFDLQNKVTVDSRSMSFSMKETNAVLPEEITGQFSIFKSSFHYLAQALQSALTGSGSLDVESVVGLEDTVATTTVLDAMLESALNGKAVVLAPPKPSNARC